MDNEAYKTVLERVRRDADAADAAISEYALKLDELRTKRAKLKDFESYLRAVVGEVEPADAKPASAGDEISLSLSGEEISQKATEMLRAKGAGKFVRAIDVALALAPSYERESDKRNFENRVYTILKRRPNEFVRMGKGQWTLKAFGLPPVLDEEDDEVDEPSEFEPL